MIRAILLSIKKSLYEGETVFLIERRTIIVVDGVVTDEIMFYFFLLLRSRRGGTDRYLFVYLPGVSIDNRRAEMLGYRQGCFALAHTRRTEKYKQCIQCIDFDDASANDVLTNDASFRCRDKVDDVLYLRRHLQFTLYLLQAISNDSLTVDESISIMDEFDEVVAKTVTAQTYEVDSGIACRLLACNDVRRNVLTETATTLDHHVSANLAELMAEDGSGDDSIVINRYLTGKFC